MFICGNVLSWPPSSYYMDIKQSVLIWNVALVTLYLKRFFDPCSRRHNFIPVTIDVQQRNMHNVISTVCFARLPVLCKSTMENSMAMALTSMNWWIILHGGRKFVKDDWLHGIYGTYFVHQDFVSIFPPRFVHAPGYCIFMLLTSLVQVNSAISQNEM